jgi:YVTN family beta-propeller protein
MHSWPKTGLAIVLLLVLLGPACNDVYRPIAYPVPVPGGDPGTADEVAVLQPGLSGNPDIVSIINATGDTNVGNKQFGPGAAWITFDASKSVILTANTSINTVTAASLLTSTTTTATLTQNSRPVFLGTRRPGIVYVVNQGVVASCDVPVQGIQSASIGIVLSGSVSLSQNTCLKFGSSVSHHPIYLTQTSDTSRVVVLDDQSNEAWILDGVNYDVMANIGVGSTPVWAVTSPDSTTAYVINRGSSDISVVNLSTDAVVTTVPTGGSGPVYAAVDTKLTRLYVVNQGDSTLSVFDISHSVPVPIRTGIPVGPSPNSVTILPDGSAAYVANTGANYITRIDGSSFVRKDITVNNTVGAKVNWVASSVAGLRVYATTYDPTNMSNGTAIIRTVDDTVVLTIPAPQQDLNCVPTQNPSVTCPLLVPTVIASRQ